MSSRVPEEILRQLGGSGRLTAMIGATKFVYGKDALTFHFKMCKKANAVKITLTPMDTYTITFYKVGKVDFKEVEEFDDVYCDNMREIIEDYTGLYLSL